MNFNTPVPKVIINAPPRSGTAYFLFLIEYTFNQLFNIDNEHSPDIYRSTLRSHNPEMLLATFPKTTLQTSIIRNPLDLIPSIVTKTIGGLGNTVSLGKAMPHELDLIPPNDEFILGQIQVYSKYLEFALKNIDNLTLFTFEQITQEPDFVMDKILNKLNISKRIEYSLFELLNLADKYIVYHKLAEYGYNNPLPIPQDSLIKKPKIYYELKEQMLSVEETKPLMNLYDLVKQKITS